MGVRGTHNYIYYTDKVLGHGSSGYVYFGRHKRKGDTCAVKIFPERSDQRHPGSATINNELDFMRRLRHKNIVSLLDIEEDLKSKDVALVMEYCSYGSLCSLLLSPDNYYGLPEEQFLNFLFQFCDGLEYLRMHGITHRDIKPANILCTKTECGSIWFKITDFGASNEYLSQKPAVFGTEEYLHPDAYNNVFMMKRRVPPEMEVRCELWSIGATLFEVLTGKKPFSVPGGRKNREKMFALLSHKKAGDISGSVEERSGEFLYRDHLPDTCFLSESLSAKMLLLLRQLLESDYLKQMTFEKLFPLVGEMRTLKLLNILDVSSMVIHRVYFDEYWRFSRVKEAMSRFTDLKETQQFYLVRRKHLEVDDEDLLYEKNPAVLGETLIMLPLRSKFPNLKHVNISNYPKTHEKNQREDYMWSLEASGWCRRVYKHMQDLANKQVLISDLSDRVQNVLDLFFRKVEWMLQTMKNWDSRCPIISQLAGKFQKSRKDDFRNLTPFTPACLVAKCAAKAQLIDGFANKVKSEFLQDREKVMKHNEEQIHKYKKSKLEEKLKELQSLYRGHCEKELERMHKTFKQWYMSSAVKLLELYQDIEDVLIKSTRTESEVLEREIKKNDFVLSHLVQLVEERSMTLDKLDSQRCS